MRNPNPGQDEETRVIGNETDIPTARFGGPSDITVAAAQMARGRTPRQTGDGPGLSFTCRPHQILQVFAYRLFIPQVMMLFHQTVEQRFVRRFSDLLRSEERRV